MSHSLKFCRSCHTSLYCTLILSASLFLLEFSGIFFQRTANCFEVSKMDRNEWGFGLEGKCSHHLLAKLPDFSGQMAPEKTLPPWDVLQRIHIIPSQGRYLALGHNKQRFLRGRMPQLPWHWWEAPWTHFYKLMLKCHKMNHQHSEAVPLICLKNKTKPKQPLCYSRSNLWLCNTWKQYVLNRASN